jgi:hypothetical protein
VASEAPPGAPPPTSALATAGPLDADDTRGVHLRRLVRHPLTISLGLTAGIAAFTVLTATVSAIAGLGGFLAALLLTLAIAFAIANNRAREDFFAAYASARGLVGRAGRDRLPPLTPLLRKGDERYCEQVFRGLLPGEVEGRLAHYTYEEKSTDSKGNQQTAYHRFTVVLCDAPESAIKTGELYCQRRVGFRFLDSMEDAFRTKQRVELESEDLDRSHEIFADEGTDPNWLRQLLSPSFIVWLNDEAPDGLAFELVAGILCVNVEGHLDSAAELDALCEAAAVVRRRVVEESLE